MDEHRVTTNHQRLKSKQSGDEDRERRRETEHLKHIRAGSDNKTEDITTTGSIQSKDQNRDNPSLSFHC